MNVEQRRTASHPATPTAVEPDNEGSLRVSVEAILLTVDRPLTSAAIASALGLEGDRAALVERTIDQLNREHAQRGGAFRFERVAGGWRATTVEEAAPALAAFHNSRASARLSRAALETLAIVAYRQPITRAQIEAIRGVACGEVLRALLERDLVAATGRAEEVGRPLLYGTTRRFLEVFGLASLKDLPALAAPDPASAAASAAASTQAEEAGGSS